MLCRRRVRGSISRSPPARQPHVRVRSNLPSLANRPERYTPVTAAGNSRCWGPLAERGETDVSNSVSTVTSTVRGVSGGKREAPRASCSLLGSTDRIILLNTRPTTPHHRTPHRRASPSAAPSAWPLGLALARRLCRTRPRRTRHGYRCFDRCPFIFVIKICRLHITLRYTRARPPKSRCACDVTRAAIYAGDHANSRMHPHS